MPCQLPSTFCPFGLPYCNLAVAWQLKSSSVFMTPDRQLNLPVSSLCFVFAGFCAQPARPLHYPTWKTDLIEGEQYLEISGQRLVIVRYQDKKQVCNRILVFAKRFLGSPRPANVASCLREIYGERMLRLPSNRFRREIVPFSSQFNQKEFR